MSTVTESTPATTTAVSLRGITRRFGHKWALRGIQLDVTPGELVVIQGHNGGGKSTLLRVIATAVQPTGGSGEVLGYDLLRQRGAIRAGCAMLGSSNGLYEDLTARENLQFAARMLGRPDPATAVEHTLARVGLLAEAGERVRFFSSGMQRRLAIARLLLRESRILLLDEPFNALDADGAALVNALVADTLARDAAVIVVLHDVARLALPPQRLLTMQQGRLA